MIASTAFGITTKTIEDGDSVFLQKVRWLFSAGNRKMPLHRRLVLFFMCMFYITSIFYWLLHFSEFQKLTLEVIASTAFGFTTKSIEEGDSIFLQKVRYLFSLGARKIPWHRRLVLFFMCRLFILFYVP